MLRYGLVWATLTCACTVVHAENWQVVFASPLGKIFVDRSPLRKEPHGLYAWFQSRYFQAVTADGVTYDTDTVRLVIQCDLWQVGKTSVSKTLHGRTVVRWQGKSAMTDIIPGTPFESAAKTLCGR